MMYLQPKLNDSGAYYSPQSTYAPGLLFLPDEFVPELEKYSGFVKLTIDGDTVTAIDGNAEALAAWETAQAGTVQKVSELDQLRADVDYIAIMTGVEL